MSGNRILFVTRYHYLRRTGGAELQCWMLAREFARRGWDAHYVSENDRPDAPRELDGVSLHYLPEAPNWRDGNREGILRVMNDLAPDVVYNRVFNLYTAHAMRFAPKQALTIWASAAAHDGAGLTLLAELWETKSLKQFLALVPRTTFIRWQARRGALKAKLQLAQSAEQLARLAKQGFHPILLRNSLQDLTDAEQQSHEGKPLVLWVGSIKQWKRPGLFFNLAWDCADLDCEFVLAGDLQDTRSEAALTKAQRELRNFRYAGFVPSEQIGKLYDKAHVLVSTSRAEGFPNTFTQAWLRGTPVLSLDVDPDSLLSREGLGRFARTTTELESKLRELLANSELRREIGARAREFAKREFDLQANVDKLEVLIRERRTPPS